jgi:hypothetical protein
MRGRGIDFEHRFFTSRWAEDLLINGLGTNHGLLTARFGLSEVRPDAELAYGTTEFKEPDLLVYELAKLDYAETMSLKGLDLVKQDRADFGPEGPMSFVLGKALAAIEVEFSPYKAREMAGRDWKPRTVEHWERRPLKHANPPTAPNIWVKEEDLEKLLTWERMFNVPIVVVHIFDQEAFAIPLKRIAEFDEQIKRMPSKKVMLQVTTGIFTKVQSYDRVDAQGAGEQKPVFIVTPATAIKAGDVKDVVVGTQLGVSSSKKYVSHTLFSGGRFEASKEFLDYLRKR